VESLNSILDGLKDCEKDYYTVAIIGSQNSGKSTLLNYMFKTNFQVLTGTAGTRTTRGVVLGRDQEQNLILMDVEGNDSWENHVSGDSVRFTPLRVTKRWCRASPSWRPMC
jgi:predicted GTPase